MESTAVKVVGSVKELKNLASNIVENPTENRRIQVLLNRVDAIKVVSSLKSLRLPTSSFFEERVVSKTPELCTVKGETINRLKKGTCVITYTITDSGGNKFTTDREIDFRN